mmetsp:Transcript_74697/g.118747  ORF Transcript_74697/g.118747 Transcript_74697/m.118747 type:complete len:231 (+) Transcript_74697:246-938(+)
MEALMHGAPMHSALVQVPAISQKHLDHRESIGALLQVSRRAVVGLGRRQKHGGRVAPMGPSPIFEGHTVGAVPNHIASTALWAGTALLGAARVPGEFTETQLLWVVSVVVGLSTGRQASSRLCLAPIGAVETVEGVRATVLCIHDLLRRAPGVHPLASFQQLLLRHAQQAVQLVQAQIFHRDVLSLFGFDFDHERLQLLAGLHTPGVSLQGVQGTIFSHIAFIIGELGAC